MLHSRVPFGLGVAFFLAAGNLLQGVLPPGFAVFLGIVGLLSLWRRAAFRSTQTFLAAVTSLVAVACLATAAGLLRAPRPCSPVDGFMRDVTVAGRIIGWKPTTGGTAFRLRAYRIGGKKLSSPFPVLEGFAPARWGALPASSWLCVQGDVESNRGATNPGAPRYQRADARLVPARGVSPDWGPGETPSLERWRRRLTEGTSVLRGFPRRLAVAMLLGRSGALSRNERTLFRRTGASHLVAVSGLHVGLAASLVILLLSAAPRGVRFAAAGLAAWAYAGIAGWSPSAVRAATLVTLYGIGASTGRTRSGSGWLFLALPWLLWTRPDLLDSVSFRLSVGAVGGILFALELARLRSGIKNLLPAMAVVSLGAQWGTLPTTLAAFGTVSPFALVPNLIVIPLAGLFLPAVLLAMLTSGVPILGTLFREAAQACGALIGTTLHLSARVLPFVSGVTAPPVGVLVLFPVLLALWFSAGRAHRRARSWRVTAAVLAALAVGLCFLPHRALPGPWVAFLDVGQGDAAVFRLSDGSVWVVDVGDDRGPGDAARNVILPFLRHSHLRRVQGVILSHRHRDHVGSLGSLVDGVAVDEVYGAGYGSRRGTSGRVDSVLAAHRLWPCLTAAGDTLHRTARASIVALYPPRGDPMMPPPGNNLNEASLVVRVVDGPLRVLFTGDGERLAEAACLAGALPLRAYFLKVGHHGSATSTSGAFLQAVAPRCAIISCGVGNPYGHPDSCVVRRLRTAGVTVFRTDRDGAILCRPGAAGEWIVRRYAPRNGGR